MKCSYCGNEIEEGKVYCDKCGKPVQMVPDYSPLEDDLLPQMINDEKEDNSVSSELDLMTKNSSKDSETSEKKSKNKDKIFNNFNIKAFLKNTFTKKRIVILIIILIAVSSMLLYYFSPSHQISLGKECLDRKDYAGALSYFLVASNEDGSDELLTDIGTCYFRLKDYDNASNYFEQALEKNKENLSAFTGLLNIAIIEPDYNELSKLNKLAETSDEKKLISKYIVSVPEFSIEGGEFQNDIELELSSSDGSAIYYTLDGSIPDKTNGSLYKEPIILTDGKTTVTARCINDSGFFGEANSEDFSISYENPSMPEVSPDAGTYNVATAITITTNQKGARIYYAWDENEPSINSTPYSGPIPLQEGTHILSAVAINKKGLSSAIYRGSFTYLPSEIPDGASDGTVPSQSIPLEGENNILEPQ